MNIACKSFLYKWFLDFGDLSDCVFQCCLIGSFICDADRKGCKSLKNAFFCDGLYICIGGLAAMII